MDEIKFAKEQGKKIIALENYIKNLETNYYFRRKTLSKNTDTSFLEQYRTHYENGEDGFDLQGIMQKANIGARRLSEHIKKYKWNTKSWRTKQKEQYILETIEKLQPYKEMYINGCNGKRIGYKSLAKKIGIGQLTVQQALKLLGWKYAHSNINTIPVIKKPKKQKPIITQINNTPKLLTIKDCVKDFCKQNIKKNIETVLIFDAYSIQVKIQKQKVMVEHKPYLLESYTTDYINQLEKQYAKK